MVRYRERLVNRRNSQANSREDHDGIIPAKDGVSKNTTAPRRDINPEGVELIRRVSEIERDILRETDGANGEGFLYALTESASNTVGPVPCRNGAGCRPDRHRSTNVIIE